MSDATRLPRMRVDNEREPIVLFRDDLREFELDARTMAFVPTTMLAIEFRIVIPVERSPAKYCDAHRVTTMRGQRLMRE